MLVGSGAAQAAAVSIAGGMSTFRLKAGSDFDRDGGFGPEFRPQISFESVSLGVAMDIFYQGRLGSNFGGFPLSRFGVGGLYYPAGLPIKKTVVDNGITTSSNHFAPFISVQVPLTVIAVTSRADALSFNALTIGYQIGVGAEIPILTNMSLLFELFKEGTLAGGAATGGGIEVSLYSGLIGFTVRP